jgi:glucosamine--fructose-6-phosphate aminotransferase (isomerizing)
VAATKTFVSQVAACYLLALRLAELRGTLAPEVLAAKITELKHLPHLLARMLENGTEDLRRIARDTSSSDFFLYLGRHAGLPVALEGALKLKEISYIAADAYAAGEMKHGPIALLDQSTPVVVVATDSPVLDEVITIPATDWMLAPLLAVVPLQLLAYYIASERGCSVDQPRNLAKTVTVE